MVLPTSDIKPRSGMKGKAVHIIHVYQDYLWTMGDKSEPPQLSQELDESDDEEGVGGEVKEEIVNEKEQEEKEEKLVEQEPVKQLSIEGKKSK
jgi:translation initiation factor 2D